jgi:hypothetical protein
MFEAIRGPFTHYYYTRFFVGNYDLLLSNVLYEPLMGHSRPTDGAESRLGWGVLKFRARNKIGANIKAKNLLLNNEPIIRDRLPDEYQDLPLISDNITHTSPHCFDIVPKPYFGIIEI